MDLLPEKIVKSTGYLKTMPPTDTEDFGYKKFIDSLDCLIMGRSSMGTLRLLY